MTGTNHGMTGAIIALTVKNPLAAVPLAFVSHFAQDTLPHWDYGLSRRQGEPKFFSRRFNTFLSIDFLLSVTIMVILAFMFPAHKWLIWGCMAAAACPDLMWAYYRLYVGHIQKAKVVLPAFARFHKNIQLSQTSWGVLVELVWFAGTWLVITNLR